MACKSKYCPIAIKLTGYLPLYEDTSAIDFEADRSIRLAGHGPKVGHNELDCATVCKLDRKFQGVTRMFFFYISWCY